MASNLKLQDTENMFSPSLDSDEVREMYCEHCEKLFKKYVPVEGFCVTCVEYLCDTCLQYHQLYHPTHSLQDKNNMPQDFYLEKCDIHRDKLIKIFCDNCQKPSCLECKYSDHMNCQNVNHLSVLARGIEKSKQFKHIHQVIQHLTGQVNLMKSQIDSNLEEIEVNANKAYATIRLQENRVRKLFKKQQQADIDKFDDEMERAIAKLKKERQRLVDLWNEKQARLEEKLKKSEDDFKKQFQASKMTDQTLLQALKGKNEKVIKDISTLSLNLNDIQMVGQRCKLFLTMKEAQSILRDLEISSNKVSNNIDNYYIRYVVPTAMREVKSLKNIERVFQFRQVPVSRRERFAEHYSDIVTNDSNFFSLCLLTPEVLLKTDYNGNSINIYKNISVAPDCTDIVLASEPWDLTKVTDKSVAVTFPFEGILRILTFSDSLTAVNTYDISVGPRCYGIAYSKKTFIVSYNTKFGEIKLFDMSGNVFRSFSRDDDGNRLFSVPWYLTVSHDHTTIYVSDFDMHTVTSLTFDGKVKAIYKDNQLNEPRQMSVDEAGTVYVCGTMSNNVYQLSSDLTKVKILLDESQGLNLPVRSVYCQTNKRLYVGMWKSNIVKVFNLNINE